LANRLQKGSSGTRHPIVNYVTSHKFLASYQNFLDVIIGEEEPKHFQESVKHPKWRKAMVEEIEALKKNEIWSIVDLPPSKKSISCK